MPPGETLDPESIRAPGQKPYVPPTKPPVKTWDIITDKGTLLQVPITKIKTKRAALQALAAQAPAGETIQPDTLRLPGKKALTASKQGPVSSSNSPHAPVQAPAGAPSAPASPTPDPLTGISHGGVLFMDPTGLLALSRAIVTMVRDTRDFAVWSARMVQRFGKWVQPHLAKLWELAKQGAEAVAKYLQTHVPLRDLQSAISAQGETQPTTPGDSDALAGNPSRQKPPLERQYGESTVAALHEFYLSGPQARREAQQALGGRTVAREAARSVAPTGAHNSGGSQSSSAQSSARQREALLNFGHAQGLMFDPERLDLWMAAHYIPPGNEHRVAHDPDSNRAVKTVSVEQLKTPSIYAYLTDHIVATNSRPFVAVSSQTET